MKLPSNLLHKLDARRLEGSLRSLASQNDFIDFSSNDYLGFAKNTAIRKKVMEDMHRYPTNNGSSGSRLLSGNFDFHEALETDLARFFKSDRTLLFNSGYDANIGLLSSILQRSDRIFYDEFSHASIRDGIRLSYAKAFGFKHNDLDDLRRKLNKTSSEGEKYLVVEAVYSMDGDMAPLKEMVEISKEFDVKLIVDEAHSTGVYGSKGQGIVIDNELDPFIFARIYTFGKAMGCHGATVAGDEQLIHYLLNFARSFIYTTAMPLHNVLSIKNALAELEQSKERQILWQKIAYFKEMISNFNLDQFFIESDSPIQSCVIGSTSKVKTICEKLRANKFDAKPILSPTVASGQERIRFCIHSYNTLDDIHEILFLLSTFV